MKNILVVASETGGRIKIKHIELKPEKHSIVFGRLKCKKTDKDLGQINRVYSEE